MKKILLSIALLVAITTLNAQGIIFFQGTFDEAIAKAKAENKIIFMDAYAEWCGPCKRMAATVFVDEKVGKYMNDNFINLKTDMEKGEGVSLQRRFDVSAYPTLLFINGEGKLVQKSVGALPVDGFLSTAKQALSKLDNIKDLEKNYNEGKRDADLVYQYVRALNRSGKPSLKVVNDYLLKANFSEATTQKIIFEGTTQSDSKVFDLLIKNKAAIVGLYSEQQFNDKIESAIERTLDNAVQFKTPELHKEAKDKMKKHLPAKAEAFALEADMRFFKAAGDAKKYCKTCESMLKKDGKADARQLYVVAKQMTESFPEDKNVMQDAEKYLKKAAESGGMMEYYLLYAQTLNRNGKKNEALENAEKALKIAKETQIMYVPQVQDFIEKIKQG
jgi:thioredoxin-related protein